MSSHVDSGQELNPEPLPVSHVGFLPTPTVELTRLFPNATPRIFAKLDNLQMSGSTKERTAASLLDGALSSGELAVGGTVIESTSGNLGMALARQCTLRGVHFIAVVDERANAAACQVMRAFGAVVDVVATPPDGNRLRGRVERVQELLASISGSTTTNQYGNALNPKAHSTSTLPEICDSLGGAPTRLFVATSTTGTILGCLNGVAALGLDTQVVGVDSQGSVLFGGAAKERYLPGLGAGFETELSRHAHPSMIHRMPEVQMVRGTRILAQREGILAGASTGALVAAIGVSLAREELRPAAEEKWVFLVHDGGLPYLPNAFDDEWVRNTLAYDPSADNELGEENPFTGVAHELNLIGGGGGGVDGHDGHGTAMAVAEYSTVAHVQ